jgi:hypothetical protein
MDEDIVVPIAFFVTVIVIAIVVPIVRATVRQWDRKPQQAGLTPELEARLDRLEAMVETISVEVERMAEGQRFTTRLLAEGAAQPVVPQMRSAAPAQASNNEVTHA